MERYLERLVDVEKYTLLYWSDGVGSKEGLIWMMVDAVFHHEEEDLFNVNVS